MKAPRTSVCCLLTLGWLVVTQSIDAQPPAPASTPPGDTVVIEQPISAERVLTAVYYDSAEQLNTLGADHDIWHVDRENGYATIYLRLDQSERLVARGFRTVPLADVFGVTRAKLDSQFFHYDSFVSNSRSRYLVNVLDTVTTRYPTLTEVFDLGSAWETTHGGHDRNVWAVRITNEDAAFGDIEDKPAFFLFSNIHAREVATPELALRYMLYLLNGFRGQGGYDQAADTTWLIDHHVVYVVVMQNPDGHAVNEADTDAFRRKNTNDLDGCGNAGLTGVDLNRNHSFQWGCCGGSSPSPCDETFRGSGPASEPETQAFQNFFAQVMKDQNGPNGDNEIPPAASEDTEGIFITLHSYGDLVLWPWNFYDFGDAPNANQLETIGTKFSFFNDFDAIGDIGYEVDGASDDWVYGKFGIPSFTFEVGGGGFGGCSGFFPDYRCLDGFDGRDFWAENRPAFLYAHKIAGSPYRTAFGPDAFNFSVSGTTVSGTIEDRRTSGQTERTVAEAEYFIDTPGAEGTGVPFSPSDGNWNEVREPFSVDVDTNGVPAGRHYVLIRGRTNGGAWGPLTAAWIDVP